MLKCTSMSCKAIKLQLNTQEMPEVDISCVFKVIRIKPVPCRACMFIITINSESICWVNYTNTSHFYQVLKSAKFPAACNQEMHGIVSENAIYPRQYSLTLKRATTRITSSISVNAAHSWQNSLTLRSAIDLITSSFSENASHFWLISLTL